MPFPANAVPRKSVRCRNVGALLICSLLAGAAPAVAAPDLIIQSVKVAPTSGPNGTAIVATATILNQGDSAAGPSLGRVRINQTPGHLEATDTTLCTGIPTPAVEAGATTEIVCNATLADRPGGVNYVWAITDVADSIDQSRTDNDRGKTTFTVTAPATSPDLMVQKFSVTPNKGPNGTVVAFTATIKNQGTAPALASQARIRINQDQSSVGSGDPVVCDSIDTPALDIGASAQVQCNPTIADRPQGANYVWLDVDVTKSAGQFNITNDRAKSIFVVTAPPPPPDLVVQSIVVSPASVLNGTAVDITVTVKNQGGSASAASATRIRINQNAEAVIAADTLLCDSIPTPAIAANATAAVQCNATIEGRPPGTNYVWAIADFNQTSGQIVFDNDRANTPLVVTARPPDLLVQNLTVAPTSGSNGIALAISATIRNQGETTSAASMLSLRINEDPDKVVAADTLLCSNLATPGIAPGSTALVQCNPTLTGRPTGTNYIWAIADAAATAGQTNFDNDEASTIFTVTKPSGIPDLVVDSVSVLPGNGPNGTAASVIAVVRNQGTYAAAASTARVVINQDASGVALTDTVLCEDLGTPAIAVGSTAQLHCTPTIDGRPGGTNYVWVLADVTRSAGQTKFSNDRGKTKFTVTTSSASADLQWPLEAPRVIEDYATYGAVRLGKYHTGIDMTSWLVPQPSDSDTDVFAAGDGTVVLRYSLCPVPDSPQTCTNCAATNSCQPRCKCQSGWGNYVVVQHTADLFTLYSHLKSVVVADDAPVEKGQKLGTMGRSGSYLYTDALRLDLLSAKPSGPAGFGPDYQSDYPAAAGHSDLRAFLVRQGIKLLEVATLRQSPSDAASAVGIARKGQRYLSLGELVPGWHLLQIPWATAPALGSLDDTRYAWCPAAAVAAAAIRKPRRLTVDGQCLDSAGRRFVTVYTAAASSARAISKLWDGQRVVIRAKAEGPEAVPAIWYRINVPATADHAAKGWISDPCLKPGS